MGIVHFATVGTSPGAVTSPLAFFARHPETFISDYSGELIESVVLFCSHEVNDGARLADPFISNEYGKRDGYKAKRKPDHQPNVIKVIEDFICSEVPRVRPMAGNIYVWPIDIHDYDLCFHAIAQATLALARPDGTGKYVWANLTGGTNVINAALMQVAAMSGLIGRLYYSFIQSQDDRLFLSPPTNDSAGYRIEYVPIIKTQFDAAYYGILKMVGEWGDCDVDMLLSVLRQSAEPQMAEYFEKVDSGALRSQFLNRMDGREIVRGKDDRVSLSEHGHSILERIHLPLFQALVKRGQNVDPELVAECRRELLAKRRDLV